MGVVERSVYLLFSDLIARRDAGEDAVVEIGLSTSDGRRYRYEPDVEHANARIQVRIGDTTDGFGPDHLVVVLRPNEPEAYEEDAGLHIAIDLGREGYALITGPDYPHGFEWAVLTPWTPEGQRRFWSRVRVDDPDDPDAFWVWRGFYARLYPLSGCPSPDTDQQRGRTVASVPMGTNEPMERRR